MAMLSSYGGWAVVTGASAGIGEAFARALAAERVNLVLTARREERLRALATDLEVRHEIATRVVPLDLAADAAPKQLDAATADLDVGFVLNNAGFGVAGRFEKSNYERVLEMVRLNCVAVTAVAHLFLPRLVARRRGALVIVASAAGYQPVPLAAAYGATKAFDLMLGEALWAENRDRGVDVLAVSPGSTETEFQAVAGEKPHAGVPASDVVDATVGALGKQPSVIVGNFNALRTFGIRFAPRAVIARVVQTIMRENIPEQAR
jgi:short-subunit dehydrogenase